MNFFENQERSLRRTRMLLGLMSLAVIAVAGSVTLVVTGSIWLSSTPARAMPYFEWLLANADLTGLTALITTVFIGLASLYRVATLRGGGARVALDMGGIPVSPDDRDPLRRRLRNVVEEMAIASGTPVPDVFVLDHEPGINAFAAGYRPEDAAVAVTRGALETLNRGELQGVIAHEFSHVLNGDMRLNVRLLGPLYGILVIGLIGRTLARGSHRSRGKNSGGATIVGVGLIITGYVGLFFGRLIKAGVSRQREFLADASAVQFTRQTSGIAGALKKIAGLHEGSAVSETDAEEISHMLFASGFASISGAFATHPPLLDRIRAIEPDFTARQFNELHTTRIAGEPSTEVHSELAAGLAGATTAATDTDLIESIGAPNDTHISIAHDLLASIPPVLLDALDSPDRATLLFPAMLLHPDSEVRAVQMALLVKQLGNDRVDQITDLRETIINLSYPARLPLVELALPRIKSLPTARLDYLANLLEQLALSDDRLELFEYALLRIFTGYVNAARRPAANRWKNLANRKMTAATVLLLQIFAAKTNSDDERAAAAFDAGLKELGELRIAYRTLQGDWGNAADNALLTLADCTPRGREKIVRALLATALHDKRLGRREGELMRAFCMMLGCPVPPLIYENATTANN
jgi:Zn-dependent protease with chaperone function